MFRALLLLAAASLSFGQLRISQVYGGGGNNGATYKNDFIEVFNAGSASVSVAGMSVQYASSAGTTWQVTNLPSVSLASGHYLLIQEAAGANGTADLPTPDATGTIAMSATAGKVALVSSTTALSGSCPTTNVVDFIGFGAANCSETSPTAALTNTTAAIRNSGGCTDTNNNSSDFAVSGAANPRNTQATVNACTSTTLPTGSGAGSPTSVGAGSTVFITVTVTSGSNPASSGVTVSADLTNIGGFGTQTLYDDGTHGDVTSGNLTFSFAANVPGGTSAGVKSIPFTVQDSQGRSTTGSFNVTVTVPTPTVPISQIQGPGAVSPYVGQVVQTSGIVTMRKSNGFYMQTPDAQVDADPNTSEGILVFTSGAPPSTASVGNAVQVIGTVAEFKSSSQGTEDPTSTTELTGATVTQLTTGNTLPAPIVLTTSSINPALGFGQLERYEGMRVSFSSLTATGPTEGTVDEVNATSSSNGRFYAVPTGVARPFREPGIKIGTPLPVPGAPRWDGNLEIYEVDFNMPGDTALNVTSNTVVTNVVGVLDYFSPYYVINHDLNTTPSISGVMSAVPVSGAQANELAIAAFNIERFYDTADDPNTSDVVVTSTAFNNRLKKVSLAVRNVLKFPDVISFEEAENLTTLQAISAQINNDAQTASQPLPNYGAYLFPGNDIGGINVGFLIKSTVTVNSVTQLGKTTTYTDPGTGQPAIVFDRPPLLADITATLPTSDSGLNLKILANHLRSLNGSDTQDAAGIRVRVKRVAGAEDVAGYLQSLQSSTGANVLTLGDFNAFEFNDGYGDIIGTIKGTPAPASQVEVASTDLVTPDFTDLMETRLTAGVNRYSYTFSGSAQVLDHILVNSNLNPRVSRVEVARNDADFPEVYRNDNTRPERISDHDMPVAYVTLPNQVTSKTTVTKTAIIFNRATQVHSQTIRVTNSSAAALSGPIYVFLNGLAANVTVNNAAGSSNGVPYVSGAVSGLAAGAFVDIPVQFKLTGSGAITYTTTVFAGSF